MTKDLKEKYLGLGVLEKNFDYAVSAVKNGTKRELILKNLTSDVRKMEKELSVNLLDELFQANGGEFKYENRVGYMYSIAYLIVAFLCFLLIYVSLFSSNYTFGAKIKVGAFVGFFSFSFLFIKTFILTLRGKHRDV